MQFQHTESRWFSRERLTRILESIFENKNTLVIRGYLIIFDKYLIFFYMTELESYHNRAQNANSAFHAR